MKAASDCSTSLPLLPLVLDDVPQGLRQALRQEGVPCCHRRQGPSEGRFVLFDSRTGRRCQRGPGQVAIDVARLRGPGARDPFEELVDEQAAVHQWQIGELSITEEIAVIDKRAARRELLDAPAPADRRAGRRLDSSGRVSFPLSQRFQLPPGLRPLPS